MNKKIGVPTLGERSAFGTAGETSTLPQTTPTSRFKVFLAWSIVLLPLVWGLYVTGQTVAPLIRTLLDSL